MYKQLLTKKFFQDPDETYDQGPLLALHELNSRFYQK